MLQTGVVGLILAIAVVAASRPCGAQQVVVQQPAFQQFAAPTTVLVPDRGEAFLGGTRGGFRARGVQGPIPLGSSRAAGGGTSSATTRVSVHDFRAMDEAILREAEADRNGAGPEPRRAETCRRTGRPGPTGRLAAPDAAPTVTYPIEEPGMIKAASGRSRMPPRPAAQAAGSGRGGERAWPSA
jgi:hypothetical protein